MKKEVKKQKYLMVLIAEDCYAKEIEMTKSEAKSIKRILDDLNSDSTGYSGGCYICSEYEYLGKPECYNFVKSPFKLK